MWVNFGEGEDGLGGRLIGGSDNGTVTVYSPEAIVTSGAEAIIGQSDKHTGPVRALDFNPFQVILVAAGQGFGPFLTCSLTCNLKWLLNYIK